MLPRHLHATSPLPYSVATDRSSIFSDVPTDLIVSTNASWLKQTSSASCILSRIQQNHYEDAVVPFMQFLSPSLTDSVLAPVRLRATILNATHARCTTARYFNGGTATVSLTLDGGNTSAPSAPLGVYPAIEFAVDRRPYVVERDGALLVRTSDRLAGQTVHVSAHIGTSGVPLANGTLSGGATSELRFSLAALPAQLRDAVVLRAVLADGTIIVKSKAIVRARPPADGYDGNVWQVDHRTRGLRVNGEAFVALGWFNGPFAPAYRNEGRGDSTQWLPDPLGGGRPVAEARSLVTEWVKRGHTLARVGGIAADLTRALDVLHANGMHGLVHLPVGHAQVMQPDWPQQKAWLLGNMSLVMHHPALGGWYVCDDCAGPGAVARNLSLVVAELRAFDPYHLFWGAGSAGYWYQEAQEWPAVAGGGLADSVALDVPMVENYKPDLGAHAHAERGDESGMDGGHGQHRQRELVCVPAGH
jgi:hypothetical protein